MALISLDHVTVAYPLKESGTHTVFSGLDLHIEEGEFVSIIGQTGCGKSTLLRLVLGSEHPQQGCISVDGEEVKHPCRDRGYVPQKYSLFPDKTVIRNVAFGPLAENCGPFSLFKPSWWKRRRAIYDDSLSTLQTVGLSERDAGKYPDQLSGGMQQRVAIAQSLIMHPKVLLMDESFSALDPATRTGMQRLIRSIWRENACTVVFVTHNLAEAIYLGSRVVLIAKDSARDCSRIALDVPIPDYIRRPDGTINPAEMESLISRLEAGSMDRPLEALAEFAG